VLHRRCGECASEKDFPFCCTRLISQNKRKKEEKKRKKGKPTKMTMTTVAAAEMRR
jgi:hypothetical protein